MNGSWDAYLASPADFAGADDIITNLAKEREHGTSNALSGLFRIIIVDDYKACSKRRATAVPN